MDGVDETGVATAEGEALAHQLVVFSLAEEEYGIPITLVQEIIRYSAPRPIPGSPFHVEGVINLRGRIIPVIDLKKNQVARWLGTGKADEGTETPDGIAFYEPGGLGVAGDTLYVADTNHHRIVAIDLKTRKPRVLKIELPKK